MDLNRVAIFVRVVEERGFSAAAKALSLPKSSVSRAVALLEHELGLRLLQRSTRTIALTEAGAAFYERASRGLAVVRDAASEVTDMSASMRGTIRLTAPVDAGVWMIAPVVGRFACRYPHVHVEVVLTPRVVDIVEEGFDLALRAGPLRDTSLVARKVNDVDLALYASPRYIERHGLPASVPELASHATVLFRAVRGRATWKLVGPGGEESVDVTGPVSADELSFVRRAVLAGVGVGLLPTFLCRLDAERGKLVRVLADHVVPGGPMHLVYPSARYVPHRVVVFRDYLVKQLARVTRA